MEEKTQGARKMSANSEAVKKHYAKCDEFKIRPLKQEGQTIRAYAEAHNISVQKLFLYCVRDCINRDTIEAIKKRLGD